MSHPGEILVLRRNLFKVRRHMSLYAGKSVVRIGTWLLYIDDDLDLARCHLGLALR